MEIEALFAHVLNLKPMKRAPFSYEDLIFENRNKSYGAYELRVNYQANLMKSFFIGIGGLTLLAFIIYQIAHDPIPEKLKYKENTPFDMSKIFEIEHENNIPKSLIKNIPKPASIAAPKHVVDPLSFKMVAKVVEPIQPVKPEPLPLPVEPISPAMPGSLPAALPVLPVIGGGGAGSELGTTVLSSAAVDKLPMFPGGMDGFYNFLAKNMRFPNAARNEGISGKLFVSFVINKDGNLVEIEFVKKAGYGMEESVVAVLEKSPKWTPGQVGNQQVNTKMILPVTFNLVQ